MDTVILIALLISLIIICLLIALLLRNRNGGNFSKSIEELADIRMKAYEESTARLLRDTRYQYERQIELLQQRLDRQAEELQQRSALQFSALANEVLERQTEKLNRNNTKEIDTLLTPLRNNLTDFRKAVTDSYMSENAAREALASKIEILAKANSEISRETRNLSSALRGNTAAQGKWGELVLEQLLESVGLVKDLHFTTQTSSLDGKYLHDDEGKGLRPDVILFLPGEHKVVIDSKTSLTAYLKAMDAADNEEYELQLKNHAMSARKHVDELSTKQYHKNIKGALEHTLMFMPNDAAYLAALRGDSSLCDYAMKRNVVIVSPAHLLSVVQIISQIWRVENQNMNAQKIADLGGKLYDKIAAFFADFEAIDKNIQASAKAYEKCYRHLSSGNTSILHRAEKLREMGAKTTRRLPGYAVNQDE